MSSLADSFLALSPSQKRTAHLLLCEGALAKWQEYAKSKRSIYYRESVCGTKQGVDAGLPELAMRCVREGSDSHGVAQRFVEPIVAMQDDDLVFPEHIRYAYYSLYNLFLKYVAGDDIDDWLIANQALSAEEDPTQWDNLLERALRRAAE